MRRIAIAALLLGLAVSFPAQAESAFGSIVQERDIALAFGYLREALNAAIEGREAAPPEELAQRAESMGEELKRRGAAVGRAVIDVIEQTVREGLRDTPRSAPPALPPSSPYQRI